MNNYYQLVLRAPGGTVHILPLPLATSGQLSPVLNGFEAACIVITSVTGAYYTEKRLVWEEEFMIFS